jgi:hypothetical protein
MMSKCALIDQRIQRLSTKFLNWKNFKTITSINILLANEIRWQINSIRHIVELISLIIFVAISRKFMTIMIESAWKQKNNTINRRIKCQIRAINFDYISTLICFIYAFAQRIAKIRTYIIIIQISIIKRTSLLLTSSRQRESDRNARNLLHRDSRMSQHQIEYKLTSSNTDLTSKTIWKSLKLLTEQRTAYRQICISNW